MRSCHKIKSGSSTLAAETVGEGDPVVFLHAAVADRRMWLSEMADVGATTMAIAYDRRGFGETVAKPEEFSSVADLMAVLDALSNGSPAVLVGCSQGGRIAIDAAIFYPKRVRGLVLVAPNVTGAPDPLYPPEIESMLTRQREAESAGDRQRLSEIKARLWLDGPLASEGRVSGPPRALFHNMYDIVLRSPPVGRDTDATPNYDRLGDISAPSLIVWGGFDFPHIKERCGHLVAAMPNASAYKIPGTAHLPTLERQGAFTKRLLEFIGQLSDNSDVEHRP